MTGATAPTAEQKIAARNIHNLNARQPGIQPHSSQITCLINKQVLTGLDFAPAIDSLQFELEITLASKNPHSMLRIKRLPLAVKVSHEIKQEISRGAWREILPSEHKLSSEIGISRTTLRRALSLLETEGWIQIQQGSPTRIVKKAPKTKRSKKTLSKNIGVLTPSSLSEMRHYSLFWIDELRSILHDFDYRLQMHHGRVYFREHTGRSLSELVKTHPADCWILAFSTPYIQSWFEAHNIPAIVSGYPADEVELPFVCTDSRAMVFHAIGQLTAKGHKNIALIREDLSSPGANAMEDSFLDTCRKQAARGINGTVIKLRDDSPTTAKNTILASLKRSKPPTAFFIVNPLHSLTALTSLPRRGFQIPEDISIVTSYGDPSLTYLNPMPNHYAIPYVQLAKKLADLALKMSSGMYDFQKHNFIMPKPIKGQSIAVPKSSSLV